MSDRKISASPSKASENNNVETISQGRRRLGKAALASPVIASLAIRPAMACSVSGFISGNTSPGRTPPTCSGYGCTPGFWKNNPEAWFRTGIYSAGYCKKLLSSGICKEWVIGGTTLAQILPTSCQNPFSVSSSEYLLAILIQAVDGDTPTQYADLCHYIAAILNAASTPAYGSTVEEIQQGLCKAITSGQIDYYTTVLLANLNERGCVYDAKGACEKGFVLNSATPAQCIPACPAGYKFDPETMKCIPDSATTS